MLLTSNYFRTSFITDDDTDKHAHT